MKKVFIDTNLFIRYLVNDVPSQADQVDRLFDLAEDGQIALITGPPVFFEIAWTLKSFYGMDRKGIYECLSAIIGIPGLEIPDLEIIEDTLELYNNTSADFSDAYIAVLSKSLKADEIATFNLKHFKSLDVDLYHMK